MKERWRTPRQKAIAEKNPADEKHQPTKDASENERIRFGLREDIDKMMENKAFQFIYDRIKLSRDNALKVLIKPVSEQATNIQRGKVIVYDSIIDLVEFLSKK